jgi:hypothetical protein
MTVKCSLSWQYDELQQVGTDYGNKAKVDIYDTCEPAHGLNPSGNGRELRGNHGKC